MWTGVEFAWLVSMRIEGVDATLTALCAIGTLGIFCVSCIWGINTKLTKTDKFCASIGISAVLLGLATHEALVTIIGCIVANSIATFPTLVAAWKDPHNEPLVAWSLWLAGSIIFLSALQQDELGTLATTIAIVLEEGAIVAVLLWHIRPASFLTRFRALL